MDCLFSEIPGKGGDIGQIVLNRPEALNALTAQMTRSIEEKLIEWEKATHIKAVIVRSNDDRAFCAGGDLRLLYEHRHDWKTALEHFFDHEYTLNQRIFNFRKPYIPLLNGITMGGGAGISIHGSHRIAAETLLFAMPETGIGFFPDVGASHFLSQCPGHIGMYLGLTGARIGCDDALYANLIDYIVPYDQFDNIVKALVETPFPPTRDNPMLNKILAEFASQAANSHLAEQQAAIDQYFSKASLQDILDGLSNTNRPWETKTYHTLMQKSPTSLAMTFNQLTRAKTMDFDQCMAMEYELAKQCLQGHDLYEGIRAVIIDKDKQPHWKKFDLNPKKI